MTNSEAVMYRKYDDNNGCVFVGTEQFFNLVESNISALEENTKLKAEIEKLIEYIENQKKLYEYRIDLQLKYSDRNHEEIEQLKSELEQSVKLPCKCDNCKYADFMGVRAEVLYCMEHHRYMEVGGYCSFGKSEVSNDNQ